MKKNYLTIAVLTIFLFALDQILKEIAKFYFQPPLFLTPWFSLRYEQNYGIAWSIAVPYLGLLIMNIFLLIILPFFLVRYLDLRHKKTQILLSFILAGALGNLFDRLFRGYVIDYFSVGTFPVFNLADSLLTVSVFLIFIFYDKIKRIE